MFGIELKYDNIYLFGLSLFAILLIGGLSGFFKVYQTFIIYYSVFGLFVTGLFLNWDNVQKQKISSVYSNDPIIYQRNKYRMEYWTVLVAGIPLLWFILFVRRSIF